MSTRSPNGLPRHLTLPSLFSMVAPNVRPNLREIEVADRSEDLHVRYTGPQLEFGELDVLDKALKFGAPLPAIQEGASHVALRVDVFLSVLRMQEIDGSENMLREMLSNLAQGVLQVAVGSRSLRVPMLVDFQVAPGVAGLDPDSDYCYLTIDPLIAALLRGNVRTDSNTGQAVLDVRSAMKDLARARNQAVAAADAITAGASARAVTGPVDDSASG